MEMNSYAAPQAEVRDIQVSDNTSLRILPVTIAGSIPYLRIGNLISLVDILLIFRSSRQRLHDQLADTIVVDA